MTGQELKAVFGANVKERRQLRRLSQMKLAEMLNLSANMISDIETGKKFVGPDTLAALSEVLGTDLFKVKAVPPNGKEDMLERLSEEIINTLSKFIDR